MGLIIFINAGIRIFGELILNEILGHYKIKGANSCKLKNMINKHYVYQSEMVIDKGQSYAIMGMQLSPDKSKMIIDLELITP